MRICFRVGKFNSLSVLRQLKIYGYRYKIEKIQKLTENFEKACWRSVRTAEERAYMQKYRFLRHCLNVIKTYKQKGLYTPLSVSTNPTSSGTLSQYIIDIYEPEKLKDCLKMAEDLLKYVTKYQDKDSKTNKEKEQDSSELTLSDNIKPIINKIDIKSISETDIKKLKNIINKLKQDVKLIDNYGNNPDVIGFSRTELQNMLKI